MAAAPAIAPLPYHTRSILRSTVILTSLVQLISELIQNSLDANARSVDIGIDCDDWSCWVKDDGDGMSKDDLNVIANTEQPDHSSRYSTSKPYDAEFGTFGFRGEALASVADLSLLEISSRTASSRQSWSIILKSNQNLYTGPSIRWKRESHGTTVCVRDAFYNLPIRRRSHPSPSRTIELLRKEIETYALMFPGVAFSLKHSRTQNQLMAVPKTTSTIITFRHLFGRALVQHMQEIHKSQGDLNLSGFISLCGTLSKSYQFLYINRHPLSVCDLHRAIDKKFASSTFAKHAYDESGENSGPRPNTRRPPRNAEKKPVYVLNITIPRRNVDNYMDPAKMIVQVQNTEAVSAFLSNSIDEFLIENRFVRRHSSPQRKSGQTLNDETVRPTKKRKFFQDHQAATVSQHNEPILCENDGHVGIPAEELHTQTDAEGPSTEIIWTDPTTGEVFVVDSRTGNSYSLNANRDKDPSEGIPTMSTRRTLSYTEWCNTPAGPVPGWIKAALQENDVYASTEPRIPVLQLSSIFTSDMQCYESRQDYNHNPTYEGRDSGYSFTREDLARATVLGQVDKKFVACLMNDSGTSDSSSCLTSPPTSLVLIDQHAADERVRVERYLKDLCVGFIGHGTPEGGVKEMILDHTLPLLLTRHEALMLKRSSDIQDAFARWGVQFDLLDTLGDDVSAEEEGGGYVQVIVKSVPDVVSNKLLMGEDLRELVKGYLAELNSEVPSNSQAPRSGVADEFSWQQAVRKCPSQLLKLVNSKACRGAIMFNDPLTSCQCKKLVQQLSQTAVPFRCAHGRPSLVPLLNLGLLSSTRYPSREIDWEAFERSALPT